MGSTFFVGFLKKTDRKVCNGFLMAGLSKLRIQIAIVGLLLVVAGVIFLSKLNNGSQEVDAISRSHPVTTVSLSVSTPSVAFCRAARSYPALTLSSSTTKQQIRTEFTQGLAAVNAMLKTASPLDKATVLSMQTTLKTIISPLRQNGWIYDTLPRAVIEQLISVGASLNVESNKLDAVLSHC